MSHALTDLDIQQAAAQSGVVGAFQRRARASKRRRVVRTWLTLLPPVLFVLVTFAVPIVSVLYRAVEGVASADLPNAASALGRWDGNTLPDPGIVTAVACDIKARSTPEIADAARELNTRLSGYRSLLLRTKRELDSSNAPIGAGTLAAIDPRWSDLAYWRILLEATRSITPYYILAALDLRQSTRNGIERAPEDRRIYLAFVGTTFWICFVVTLCCAVIGYPVAYVMAQAAPRVENILIFGLLIPFWTSVLVRTAAWVIVLQPNGLVNALLKRLGVISTPLTLIYNRFGLYVAMIHVLLPFMILPIYSVMKSIPPNMMQAACSLGATPLAGFRQVYLPLSLPGLSAGVLMTFVLGLGYYITPALVGGAGEQMESGLIARFALGEANWPMAAAIAVVLLLMTAMAFLVLSRVMKAVGLPGLTA